MILNTMCVSRISFQGGRGGVNTAVIKRALSVMELRTTMLRSRDLLHGTVCQRSFANKKLKTVLSWI